MTRNELSQIREGFLVQAAQDVCGKLNEFMRNNRMDARTAANALGLTEAEIGAILNGNTNSLSMRAFATVLLISGHVIEIKPISETPMGGGMPMARPSRANFVHPHNNGVIEAQYNPTGLNDGAPKRDSRGRFAKKRVDTLHFTEAPSKSNFRASIPGFGEMVAASEFNPDDNEAPSAEVGNFDAMTREELVNLVRANHWEGEIDLDEARRTEIINFLTSKQNTPTPTPTVEMTTEDFLGKLQQIMREHPEIAQQLKGQF